MRIGNVLSFGFCFDKIVDEQPIEYQSISRKWELKSNRTCSLELTRPSSAIDLTDRSFIILLTPSSNIAAASRNMSNATAFHRRCTYIARYHDILRTMKLVLHLVIGFNHTRERFERFERFSHNLFLEFFNALIKT